MGRYGYDRRLDRFGAAQGGGRVVRPPGAPPRSTMPTQYLGRTAPLLASGLRSELAYRVHLFETESDPEWEGVDGHTGRQGADEPWATIRAGVANTSSDSLSYLRLMLRCSATTDQFQDLWRVHMAFNTHRVIPADAQIVQALLVLRCSSFTNDLGGSIVLTASGIADNWRVQTSDHGSVSDVDFSDRLALSDFGVNVKVALALNQAGLDAIKKMGGGTYESTKLALRYSYDVDNEAPAWSSGAQNLLDFDSAEYTGNLAFRPQLQVTWVD